MLKAINIKWDTDGDVELLQKLPKEIEIPEDVTDEEKISDYISEFTGFCHGGFELKRELDQKYIDILEANDWSISSYTDDGRVELEKFSPAGEDFLMCVEVEDFSEAVREYANDFDVDEHAVMWIEIRGEDGVPSTIREIVEDAESIQKMLNELADELEEKNNEEKEIEELKNYNENSYYNIEDIVESLMALTTLKQSEELKEELKNAVYYLKSVAENEYNADYFRVLYNVLLAITGDEAF